jgi:pimeloyl-ACP methyl ester carboxylesterase
VIYLHGFASSSRSGKASFFAQRCRDAGIGFEAPDLNLPDFSTLTVTRMLEQTGALLSLDPDRKNPEPGAGLNRAAGPVTLMGSSLGGYVAVLAAARWPEKVKNVVLMAPALDFSDTGLSGPGGADVGEWQRAGHLNVFHFGYGRMMPVHYELYADARRYDAMKAVLPMPVLVFQGRRDSAVDPATVKAWSEARPNVELHLLNDDHQLGASLDVMWDRTYQYLTRPVST